MFSTYATQEIKYEILQKLDNKIIINKIREEEETYDRRQVEIKRKPWLERDQILARKRSNLSFVTRSLCTKETPYLQ